MPNFELTALEFIRLTQAINAMDERTWIANENDELTFWKNDTYTKSLLEKLEKGFSDPEVKQYAEQSRKHP